MEMIGWIALALIKRRPGMTEPYARMLVKIALTVIGLIAFGLFAVSWIQAERTEAVDAYKVEQADLGVKAREVAADERVSDLKADMKEEGVLHNAIEHAPPGGQLSPAARALACERLLNLGRIPPACRPQGSDGSTARPD
jgi:hypothetical protein